MAIISFLIVGLLVGWIASMLMEGHGLGVLGDIIVGIIGAFVGSFIFGSFGVEVRGLWGEIGTSVVGAILFLFLVSFIPYRGGRTPLNRL